MPALLRQRAWRRVGATERGVVRVADEGVDLVVGLHRRARLDFVLHEGFERRLREDLARQAQSRAELDPIVRVAHVIEQDLRIFGRVGAAHGDGLAELEVDGARVDYVLPRTESLEYAVPWTVSATIKAKQRISTVYSPSHEVLTKRDTPRHVVVRARDHAGSP